MEDREEYIARLSEEDRQKMQRVPFGVVALINPTLTPIGGEGARFFEGCLSVPGYQVRSCMHYFGCLQCHALCSHAPEQRVPLFSLHILLHVGGIGAGHMQAGLLSAAAAIPACISPRRRRISAGFAQQKKTQAQHGAGPG
jgi:hypothetical protein